MSIRNEGISCHVAVNDQTAGYHILFNYRRRDCQALSVERPPSVGCLPWRFISYLHGLHRAYSRPPENGEPALGDQGRMAVRAPNCELSLARRGRGRDWVASSDHPTTAPGRDHTSVTAARRWGAVARAPAQTRYD